MDLPEIVKLALIKLDDSACFKDHHLNDIAEPENAEVKAIEE